jgi:hypothetical protein
MCRNMFLYFTSEGEGERERGREHTYLGFKSVYLSEELNPTKLIINLMRGGSGESTHA